MLVLAALAFVVALCALDLSCGRRPTESSTIARVQGELAVGRKELRNRQAEDLARVARDLRVLARHHADKGEKRKARRALAAAQEMDARIKALRGER